MPRATSCSSTCEVNSIAPTLSTSCARSSSSVVSRSVALKSSGTATRAAGLVDGGILEQRREGTRAYVKADTRSPLFADLHGLVEKTAGLLPTLQRLLEQFDTRVDVALVYG